MEVVEHFAGPLNGLVLVLWRLVLALVGDSAFWPEWQFFPCAAVERRFYSGAAIKYLPAQVDAVADKFVLWLAFGRLNAIVPAGLVLRETLLLFSRLFYRYLIALYGIEPPESQDTPLTCTRMLVQLVWRPESIDTLLLRGKCMHPHHSPSLFLLHTRLPGRNPHINEDGVVSGLVVD